MGVNTVINLPLHVTNSRILQVLGKYVGSPCFKDQFDSVKGKEVVDFDAPCSESNSWHYEFPRNHKNFKIDFKYSNDGSSGSLNFTDGAETDWAWFFHQENEDEKFKTIRPGCHALAIACGKMLVQVFGGHVIYADTDDKIDFLIKNKDAWFPKKLKNQDSNNRWYQFQNLLDKVPLITGADLDDAAELSSGTLNEKTLKLKEYVDIWVQKEKLEQILGKPSGEVITSLKNPKVRI